VTGAATMFSIKMSKLASYRISRQQLSDKVEVNDTPGNDGSDVDYGTRSTVSLLDQHSELKKKAQGMLKKRNYECG